MGTVLRTVTTQNLFLSMKYIVAKLNSQLFMDLRILMWLTQHMNRTIRGVAKQSDLKFEGWMLERLTFPNNLKVHIYEIFLTQDHGAGNFKVLL